MKIIALSSHPMRAADVQTALPVEGSGLHPEMVTRLKHLDSRLVKDALELQRPDVEEALARKGFALEREDPELRIYALGRAHLHGSGQRALLAGDGSVQLVTFAQQWIQLIQLDAAGKVLHNAVERIPR